MEIIHPEIARRDCGDCRRWLYDDGPEGDGRRVERVPGRPEPRGRVPVPCDTDAKCPKGHWTSPRSLTPQNRAAYAHHRTLKAAGQPIPEDPWMMRNALLICEAEKRCEDLRRRELLAAVQIGATSRGII